MNNTQCIVIIQLSLITITITIILIIYSTQDAVMASPLTLIRTEQKLIQMLLVIVQVKQ